MATMSLQDLVMQDLLGSTKTAAAAPAPAASVTFDDDSMAKVAMELGLFSDAEPAAAAGSEKVAMTTTEAIAAAEAARGTGDVAAAADKVAAAGGGFTDLYGAIFPDDAPVIEKTAEEEKNAAEEALGARTWDHFAARFDQRIEKLAYAALSGSPHKGDSQPPNHLPDNKAQRDAGGGAIDSTPQITDSVKDTSPEGGVGKYEQKHASLAFRKHLLMSQLEA